MTWDKIEPLWRSRGKYEKLVRGRFIGRAAAEDIVQDALMGTKRFIERYPERKAEHIFPRILWRRTKDYLRLAYREQAAGLTPFHPGIIESQAMALTRRIIIDRLQAMPTDWARAFAATELQGASTRETAEALGITEGNVKVRRHRATKELREALS